MLGVDEDEDGVGGRGCEFEHELQISAGIAAPTSIKLAPFSQKSTRQIEIVES